MLEWARLNIYPLPIAWPEHAVDGIYGDEDQFLASCEAGEQQLLYLMRRTEQHENWRNYTGNSGGDAQEPQALPSVDEELSGHNADGGE